MIAEEVFLVWTPDNQIWAKWAKPVLFSYITSETQPLCDSEPPELGHSYPRASSNVGLILDLAGPRGVFLSVRLAEKGYWPVPLYNACPQPDLPSQAKADESNKLQTLLGKYVPRKYPPAVDVAPIVSAIVASAEKLRKAEPPFNAPPVFLLDSRRRGDGVRVEVGMFDNRSVVFPSDFPSGQFFKDRGVGCIIAVTDQIVPQFDLSAVLREWKTSGIEIKTQLAGNAWAPRPLELPAPSRLRTAWFWVQTRLGMIRHSSGGYGVIRHAGG